MGSGPGSGSSLREEVEPTPVSSPGEPHEQRRVMVHQVRKSQTQPSTHAPRGKRRTPFTFSGCEKSRRAASRCSGPTRPPWLRPWSSLRNSPRCSLGSHPELATHTCWGSRTSHLIMPYLSFLTQSMRIIAYNSLHSC